MAIDMTQFHQVFFEESFENLALMEAGLLSIADGADDPETLNTIFRGVHSIKGGSSTFGFAEIADFTHVLESLLDEMRAGQRPITGEAIELLLGSVDLLGRLLEASSKGKTTSLLNVNIQLEKLAEFQTKPVKEQIEDPPPASPSGQGEAQITRTEDAVNIGWHIVFHPLLHMMRVGNDPLGILKALEQLGELKVTCDYDRLPRLSELNPEETHLSWDLRLEGACDRNEVADVFDWVEDDCDIVILPMFSMPSNEIKEVIVESDRGTRIDNASAFLASKTTPASKKSEGVTSSIRVETRKIDSLINMIGELVITQSMLDAIGENFTVERLAKLQEGLEQLKRHTSDLHECVMRVRMLPVSFAFNRFPRMVHDMSAKLGKKIVLEMSGVDTEVDKTVIEKMIDPLVHLIRNSLDHGLEMPDERILAGKSETGFIRLNAYQKGGNVFIEIDDDGRGLNKTSIFEKALQKGLVSADQSLSDEEINELIFHPGFTTTDAANDLSGRGVGMDVVRRNINELGGSIQITSIEGEGCSVSMSLPLSLAIMDGQIVRIGNESYIIPILSIIESIQPNPSRLSRLAEKGEAYKLREEIIPIIRVNELFGIPPEITQPLNGGLLVIVEGDGRLCALLVDELLGQKQVVIKSLEENYQRVEGISGATILGDGSVGLIMDIPGVIGLAGQGRGLRMPA